MLRVLLTFCGGNDRALCQIHPQSLGQRAALRSGGGRTLYTGLLFSFVIIGGKSVLSLGELSIESSIHGGHSGRCGSGLS